MDEKNAGQSVAPDKVALGVLFVHGIGEQRRGDTLIGFGDPIIEWLRRWLAHRGDNLVLSELAVTDGAPCAVTVTKPEPQSTTPPDGRIRFGESWWAEKFRAPPVFELAWWLLLVGTFATVSHGAKPLFIRLPTARHRRVRAAHWLNAFFRAVFYYTPLAITFQVVVIALAVLATVPFAPWRAAVSELLLKVSRTLGDSYVLIHSPIQRELALEGIGNDIGKMLDHCRRVLVVAHSQGAALSYHALDRVLKQGATPDRLSFVSIGSGLDKLTELERVERALRFMPDDALPAWQRRALYLLPAMFAIAWGVVLLWLFSAIGGAIALAMLAATVVAAWLIALAIQQRLRTPYRALEAISWTDILATSDPVSNGPTEGPDSPPRVIVNDRSLIRDHTAYFSNATDCLPHLIEVMRDVSGIDWLAAVDDEVLRDIHRRSKRDKQKFWLHVGKWINRIGLVLALLANHGPVSALVVDVIDTVGAVVVLEWADTRAGWTGPLAWFIVVEVFIRWCDRTSDRTARAMLFADDAFLASLRRLLGAAVVTVPLAVGALQLDFERWLLAL